MCMCGKPNINGELGYSWDGKTIGTCRVNAPVLLDGDTLVYDEPGRCGGGTDSHCHHFRFIKRRGDCVILVRHGAGDESFTIPSYKPGLVHMLHAMEQMDTNGRYWTLHLLYSINDRSADAARQKECARWNAAAIDNRIKLHRKRGRVHVEILSPKTISA